MNTRDFIRMLQRNDPQGTLEVSIGSWEKAWGTPSGVMVSLGDTGARLVLHLVDSPPLPGSSADRAAKRAARKASTSSVPRLPPPVAAPPLPALELKDAPPPPAGSYLDEPAIDVPVVRRVALPIAELRSPSDVFRCAKLSTTMAAKACVERRGDAAADVAGKGSSAVMGRRRRKVVAVSCRVCSDGDAVQVALGLRAAAPAAGGSS